MTLEERMMGEALAEAEKAFRLGEAPIGAIVARGEEILGRGHNLRETDRDATLHAEMIAIREACARLGGWRLPGCVLYVTLEPCPMCAGAAINARVEKVIYGASDPKAGSTGSMVNLFELPYNHRPECEGGIREAECAALMTKFFLSLRGKRSVKRMKKIDMHAHIPATPRPVREDGNTFAVPEWHRETYDRIGVDRCLVLSLSGSHYAFEDTDPNAESIEICRKYPEVAGWWAACIDPRRFEGKDLAGYLDWCRENGCVALGEETAEVPFDDPGMFRIYEQAERLNWSVTFHIGLFDNEYGLRDEPGLHRLENALKTFPGVTFIGHSQRFWSEIGGEELTAAEHNTYPKGKVMPGGRVPELMRKYPNLHADLSAGSGFNAITRDEEFGYGFLEEFHNQLYYACDICAPIDYDFLRLSSYLDEAVLNNRISDVAYRAICRDNALKILEKK